MKSKVSLGLSSLNAAETAQLGQNVHTAMTGNANFATPSPTLAALLAALTDALAKINASEVAADAAKTALAERDAALEALRAILSALAAYVDHIGNGDEAILLSSGMPLRPEPSPVTMTQVQNLKLTASDESGEVFADWDRVFGVRLYRVQVSTDAGTPPTNWTDKLTTTKSRCKLNHDLVSGTKVWVRIKAIGPNNEGPWSDVAWKTVP